MKVSYDGPPDWANETITIKIELQPSEVAGVVSRLIGPGAASFLPEELNARTIAAEQGGNAALERAAEMLSSAGIQGVAKWLRECRDKGSRAIWPVFQRSNLDRVLLLGMPIGMTDVSMLSEDDAYNLRQVLHEDLALRSKNMTP